MTRSALPWSCPALLSEAPCFVTLSASGRGWLGVASLQSKSLKNIVSQKHLKKSQKYCALFVQIPIGAEDRFEGVVDLVRMKGITWDGEVCARKPYSTHTRCLFVLPLLMR